MRPALTAIVAPVVAAAAIVLAGCSSATPLPGPTSGATATTTSSPAPSEPQSLFTAASPTAPPSSAGATPSLTGLSAACSAVVDTQLAIAALFAKPINGHKLAAADVSKVFSAIDPAVPHDLDGDIATLRDAAHRSIGRSDVQVAAILAEKPVAGAVTALSAYVKACSPATS